MRVSGATLGAADHHMRMHDSRVHLHGHASSMTARHHKTLHLRKRLYTSCTLAMCEASLRASAGGLSRLRFAMAACMQKRGSGCACSTCQHSPSH